MRRLAMLALAALSSGCALTKPAEQSTVLRAAPAFAVSTSVPGPSLAVSPVSARGAAADRRYVYVDRAAPREVRQAATLFWEEPPARLVERALVAGLRARLGAVVGPETPIPAERRLIAQLQRFEELTGGQAQAVVALDATLVGADRAVKLANRYCATAPIADASGSTRALAFEAALKALVERLAEDVSGGKSRQEACPD